MTAAHSAAAVAPAAAPRVDRIALNDAVFISDLHLNAGQPKTVARFERFIDEVAAPARELVILGDLFEYWAGDDELDDASTDSSASRVVTRLRKIADRGVRVFLMQGNRDLLLGVDFAQRAGAELLVDPTRASIGATTILLAHGDAWCTRDETYMRFRAQVRNTVFQSAFLAKPLPERRAFIGQARAASEANKQTATLEIMDVTPDVVLGALHTAGVVHLIHGHTHRPATHRFDLDGVTAERWVLPDWDFDNDTPRGGYLRVSTTGWQRVDLAP